MDLVYGTDTPDQPATEETGAPSLAYGDLKPTGPSLPEPVLNQRVARADFAMADKSPGPDVLKDAFQNGGEGQVREMAAAQADAEFQQEKIAHIQSLQKQGVPLSGTDVETLMAWGRTPEANPNTVLEDKFSRNFVNTGVIGEPGKNLVFQSAFNAAAEGTQDGIKKATAVGSRHQIVKGVYEDAQAALADVPWINTSLDGQQDKLTNLGHQIITQGISTYVNQRNLLNQSPNNSVLPGSNLLEQVQYLYLLPADQIRPALMKAAGPGSDLWRDAPLDAMAFIRAAVEYSTSDQYVDNVLGVANGASLIPFGGAIKGINLLRRGREVATDAGKVQTAQQAAEAVLSSSSKPPVTPGSLAMESAEQVLKESASPVPAGWYAPAKAVEKVDYSQKVARTAPNDFSLQVKDGQPRMFMPDGSEVQLSRTPEEGFYPIKVDQGKTKTTYRSSRGVDEFTSETTKAGQPEAGKIRFYHGHSDSADPNGYGAWVSTQEDYARNYRGGPNKVSYTDLTKEEAQKAGLWDDVNDRPMSTGQLPKGTKFQSLESKQTRVGDQRTIFVNKKDYEHLSSVIEDGGQLLSDDKGKYFIGDKLGKKKGRSVSAANEPAEGLYPIHLPEGNDPLTMQNFGTRIAGVDRAIDQRATVGPKIVSQTEIEARIALGDIAKAQGESHPVDALSRMGLHEQAAETQAVSTLQNRFEQVVELGDVEAIRRNIPSLASPQTFFQNSASLSAERARRLADAAIQTSSELGAAIMDPQRVERLTAEAFSRAISAAKDVIKTKFNRNPDTILDQATVWDSASNTYKVQSKIGKKDGTLFDSRVQADHYRTFQYRLGKSATVEQEGTKFYLSHVQHANETARGVREGLMVSENATPRGMWNTLLSGVTGRLTQFGTSVRSSRYTQSEFQMNNRIAATHAPSVMREVIEDAAKELNGLGRWTTNERHELQRILEHNRDFMHPDGQRGMFYNSAFDFEMAFHGMHGKMPTEKQIAAYDQFTRLSDFDWVLRELDWHRDKTRQGVRNYSIPFEKTGPDGIPQKGKTEFFNAKKVDDFDPVNTQNANIYIMPEGRFETKFDMVGQAVNVQNSDTMNKIKDGKYQILQVYNPGGKPLKDATGIKENIHFVVVDKFEDKALLWGENSVYRPGGHVIYQDSYFMKQPQIGIGAKGRETHFGDTTVKSFATPKEGQAWIDKYNTARLMLLNNDEAGLAAYINAGNLPETLPEFKQLFTDGGAGLDPKHPFVLTTTGRNTFQSSEDLTRQYPGLKDTFSSYDLTQTQDSKFLAERDAQLNTVANTGTEANPIYTNVPSRLYDPYTALQKGIAQIVRQRWMGDYKISAAESWVQEFGLLFDQSKLPMDKLRQNPVYYIGHAKDAIDVGVAKNNPELYAAAMVSRQNILNFIGARDEVGAVLEGFERKVIEGIESIGGKRLAQVTEEKLLPLITDAPEYARKAAFHTTIGMFNPLQLFQQGQGLTHVLALSPVNGLKGTTASALARMYRYTEDTNILASAADKAAALGWNRGHFLEAWQAWKTSGTHAVGGETALLSASADPKLFQGAGGWMLDKGLMFFKAGEQVVRDTAYFTAYADWRAANPTAVLNNRAMGDISRRFDTLSMNMTRASNAVYNEGILSIPTQFWTWNARFMEQMLGKQLTGGEKARALAAYSTMYGIPSTLGGVTFGVVPYMNYQDIRQYTLTRGIDVSDKFFQLFSEGVPAMLTNLATGHNTDFQRFGPNATQLKEIIDGKKSVMEMLGGASGGFIQKMMAAMYPAYMYGMNAFKKDGGFPLKMNDFTSLLETVSTFNNAEKAIIGLNIGQYVAKNENMVIKNVDTFESVMLGLGLQPKRASDAYSILDYAKHQKNAQEKMGKIMTENYKIAIRAGARGDTQTMADYMTRVHALAAAANMTKKQEIELFKRASRDSSDLIDAANRWMINNNKNLQSVPAMEQYLKNMQNRK
jgi:hypothetical protein